MIKTLGVAMDLAIWSVVLVASLICIYIVYDGLKVTKSAVLGEEILNYAPHDEYIDLKALREINPDIIGWLRIPGTCIDYPVVQGKNNDYYLVRDYMQEFATAGSIFLDYRNTIGDDFLIIYGHRMSYGGMFTDLIKFKDRLFFDEHEIGELFVDGGKWRLEIVAFGLISANNHEIYDLRGNELREMMMHAMYVREAADGRYILLSTCDSENKAMRDVLLLRIVEQL